MPFFNISAIWLRFLFLTILIAVLSTTEGQVPVISSMSPTSGPVGTPVVISGNNFSPVASDNIVYFGAVRATVTSATPTSLNVTLPYGTTYDPVRVTVNNLTAVSLQTFTVTFPGGGAFYPNSFIDAAFLNTTGFATAVVSSDFNNDGKPDIVSINGDNSSGTGSNNSVAIFKNTSVGNTISFAPKFDSIVGAHLAKPWSLIASDINGDGKQDIVTINQNGRVAILQNTSSASDISFAAYIDFSAGLGTYAGTVADVDLDGKPDVCVINNSNNTVSVFRNTTSAGVISFAPQVIFPAASNVFQITSADIDGDGKPELITANNFTGTISVFRNISIPGIISFAPKTDFTAISATRWVAVGDIDGDGKRDICTIGNNTLSVFRNQSTPGTIMLAPKVDFGTGTSCEHLSIADMDGDSKADVVTANLGNTFSVLKNSSTTGSIAFLNKVDYSVGSGSPRSVSLCDYNADSKPDLALGMGSTAAVRFIRNAVTEPTLLGFTPTIGGTGTVVTITGTNFTNATSVSFGGINASSFTVVSPTTINAVIGAGASGDVVVTTPYGAASLPGFNYTATPVINSFAPTAAGSGATVTINGNYFLGTTAVSFGGTPAASFTVVSPTIITAVVGSGSSGAVSVTTPSGTATLGGFTYTVPPTITSFTPSSGPIGSTVTINGTNFSSTAANNIVYFGSVKATITSASSNALTVSVPTGSTHALITVSANFYTASTIKTFNVTFADGGAPFSDNFFKPNIDTLADENHFGVASGDFDGDGKVDMAVTSFNAFSSNDGSVSIYRNTSNSNSFAFAAKVRFQTNFQPRGVVAADINSDGKLDLVIPSWPICYLINTSTPGTISFASPQTINVGQNLQIVVADFDADGRPDLAATYPNGSSVSIYRNLSNNGVISFIHLADYPTGNGPNRVATGDFNNDGKPDLAVANAGSNTLSILRNTSTIGSISFTGSTNLTTGSFPSGVAVADLDGDGKTDVAVSNQSSSSLSVFRNTGIGSSISFASKVDLTVGDEPLTISIGDLNGDDKIDLLTTNRTDSTVSILKNTSVSGSISFQTHARYKTGAEPLAVAVADWTGDGKPDVAVANLFSRSISLLQNQHNRPVISSISPTTGTTGTVVAINGFNFNGATSVQFGGNNAASFTVTNANTISAVAGEGYDGDVTVTTPLGTASFAGFRFMPPVITSFSPLAAPVGAQVIINGNNFSSVASNNTVYFGAVRAKVLSASTNTLTVVVPTGATYQSISVTTRRLTAYSIMPFTTTYKTAAGPFTPALFNTRVDFPTAKSNRSLVVKDFDNDSLPDIIVPAYYDTAITVLRNTSNNGVLSFATTTINGNFTDLWFANSADFNGDGKPDLIITDYGSERVYVFKNTSIPGTISFAAVQEFDSGDPEPRSIAIDDIDGDGKPDIAVANGFNTYTILRNTSMPESISFAQAQTVAFSNLPVYVALGDFDKDGKPDLVTANNTQLNIGILRNVSTPGNIAFAPITSFSLNGFPWALAIGDVDVDGKLDIAVSVQKLTGGSVVSVFKNASSGNIAFSSASEFAVDGITYGIAFGDINGDGKPDLTATNASSGTVSVLQNISPANSIAFDNKVNFQVGSQPYAVQIGDINGDRKADVITANAHNGLGGSVSVLLNNLTILQRTANSGRNDLGVQASPNPVSQLLNVDISKDLNNVTLRITSLTGAVSYISSYNSLQAGMVMQVPMQSLPRGLYILKITSDEGESSIKIMKN